MNQGRYEIYENKHCPFPPISEKIAILYKRDYVSENDGISMILNALFENSPGRIFYVAEIDAYGSIVRILNLEKTISRLAYEKQKDMEQRNDT